MRKLIYILLTIATVSSVLLFLPTMTYSQEYHNSLIDSLAIPLTENRGDSIQGDTMIFNLWFFKDSVDSGIAASCDIYRINSRLYLTTVKIMLDSTGSYRVEPSIWIRPEPDSLDVNRDGKVSFTDLYLVFKRLILGT